MVPKPEEGLAEAATLVQGDASADTLVADDAIATDETLAAGETMMATSTPRAVDPSAATELSTDLDFGARYSMGSLLGEGGMGEVRACNDTHIGREVAIKVIRPGHGSRSDLAKRFLREARVQGQLEHPSIVPVYDLGRDPTGAAYFTMKRVRGLTLEDILRRLREGDQAVLEEFSQRKLLSALSNVCLTVHFAHARGVLHRDLKPANVMLGAFGEVYVLDWGLAKLVKGEDLPVSERTGTTSGGSVPPKVALTDEAGKTAVGAIMGTPGYMAPEQVQGDTEHFAAQTDIYALGAILFEILTLRELNTGRTPQDLLMSTLRGSEARPSVRAPDRDVAPELEAICVRATALAPADRYESARDMYDAIEGYLDGDRDLERRRVMAAKHVEAAEAAAERARARAGGPESAKERALALQEIGRAVSLEPGNARAQQTMFRLLTEPPREMPEEALADYNATAREQQKVAMRTAAVAFSSWFLYLPLAGWMGPRNHLAAMISEGTWILAAAACFYVYKWGKPDGSTSPIVYATGGLAVMSSTLLFGPLMILPALAASVSLSLVLTSAHRGGRRLAVMAGWGAILVPLALQLLGVLPNPYVFENGAIVIRPNALNFPETPTLIFLTVSSLASLGTAAIFVSRVRDALNAAQRRLVLQSWQLRQLMPKDAHGAMSKAPPPPTRRA